MTYLSLFAGCGGLDRAMPGQAVAHVEWDAYAQRVLRRHWPDVPVLDDVRTVNGADFRGVDWVIGGPPCQAASHAGLQLGEADPRWMWPEAIRVLRECEAPGAFWENVPGLCTLNAGRSFGAILSALTALGYFVRWDHCTAAEMGRPHLRDRVWIVATRTPGPMGWMSVPIAQVRKWPRAGWAWEGRTGEDVARWPKREVWSHVDSRVCPPGRLWPTAASGDPKDTANWTANRDGSKGGEGRGTLGVTLVDAMRLWPTPRASDSEDPGLSRERREAGVVDGLRVAARLWPTPTRADGERASETYARGNETLLGAASRSYRCPRPADGPRTIASARGRVLDFAPCNDACTICDHCGEHIAAHGAVPLWPTPQVSNGNGDGEHGEGGANLQTASRLWPTPDANCWKGSKTPEQRHGQLDAAVEPGKWPLRLNPAWVESLLMGWPLGWTLPEGPSLADAPAPPRDEEIAPRLTDVREHRRDRLRLTGNGVVTETAALVWDALVNTR